MVIHLSTFTYTNKSFTSFFTFKQEGDLYDLNKALYKSMQSNELPEVQLNFKTLNQNQIDYLNGFLKLYVV
jgi:hypothetical protein